MCLKNHPTYENLTLYQPKLYATQRIHDKAFDKFGNKASKDAPEAHIPIQEFIYRE